MSRLSVCLSLAKSFLCKPSPSPEPPPFLDNPTGATPEDTAALVQALLGCSRSVSDRVLHRAGSLDRIARYSPAALAFRTGLAVPQAQRLLAAIELGRRGVVAQTAERPALHSPESVAAWLRPRMAGLAHEELWMLALDTQHQLLGACRISQGFRFYSGFAVPAVLQRALEKGAFFILLAHNHPGGTLAASEEDLSMTAHLYYAARAVCLTLSDHVILGRQGYLSMRAERLLPETPMPAIEALCPDGDYAAPIDWIAVMEQGAI